MNAFVTLRKSRRSRAADLTRGVATLTFDHTMRNHRVRSDREAFAHDAEALRSDFKSAWSDLTADRELDPA